jgi:PAS domain S-box-containing protein
VPAQSNPQATAGGIRPDVRQQFLDSHYRAIVESSDDAIISKDDQAIITSWNGGAERLYGYSRAEAIGQPVSILIPPHRAGEERRILDQILAGGRVEHYETERVRRDGRMVVVSLTVSPVHDDAGTVIGASVIARDISEQRRTLERTEALQRITAALSKEITPGRTVHVLVEEAVPALGAIAGAVGLLDEDRAKVVLVGSRGYAGPAFESLKEFPLEAKLPMSAAIRSREPVWCETAEAVDQFRDIPDHDGRFGALAVVPLVIANRAFGAIALSFAEPREFDVADRAFITTAAQQAAYALERAERYRRDHEAAVTLQRALLPRRLPVIDSCELAAVYLPAEAAMEVGGDWYDAAEHDDGRLTLSVGDVAGHGIGAASVMGQLRTALRAFSQDGAPPGAMLEWLNRLMCDFDEPQMATIFLARFDPHARACEYTRAGHPPPLVRTADGMVTALPGPPAPPVGIFEDAGFGSNTVDLEPGSTLVMYTDGLIERRGHTLDEDLSRLGAALRAAPKAPSECLGYLVDAFGVENRADDVALVALRVE